MTDENQTLQQIIQLETEITQIQDLDLLMERILTEARRLVHADAGSIYLKNGDILEFGYTQNDSLQRKLPQGQKLIYHTFFVPIDNTTIAGYVANTGKALNIANVHELPAGMPYRFGKEYDARAHYHTQSMLTLPLKTLRGDSIGVLQIINAQNETGEILPFSHEEELLIRHFAHSATVALERAQITRTIFLRMIRMAELRDPQETGPHVNRVAAYATELYEVWAKRRGLRKEEIDPQRDLLRSAAMLHDVGKVGVPDTILKKPAKLTPSEYDLMKQHTLIGTHLFADPQTDFDEAAAIVALTHHERWDGQGYPGHVDPMSGQPLAGYADEHGHPSGKKGEEIPLWGRVVAVADVYDALCSKRVYKGVWREEEALTEMQAQAGQQFDPELVADFLSIHNLIQSIKARYPDRE